jgi:hypothetical protein
MALDRIEKRGRDRIGARLPARSPLRTSLHHCKRISPGNGSRATSRTRAISALKA